MRLTSKQRDAIKVTGMSEIIKRDMFHEENILGYCERKKRYYAINIASDLDTDESIVSTTLHEIGHIYYGHMDVNYDTEREYVKKLAEDNGYDFKLVMAFYGGFNKFLNIAFDLEVNEKLLTDENIRFIERDTESKIVTLDNFQIPHDPNFDTFRDYYLSLFEVANDNTVAIEGIRIDMDIPMDGESEEGDGGSESEDGVATSSTEGEKEDSYKKSKSDIDSCETIGETEMFDQIETKTAGRGSGTKLSKASVSADEAVKKFVEEIVRSKINYETQYDSIKLYNRNSRGRDYFYTSTRRKPIRSIKKPKFLFILDVSGSMDVRSIFKAITSLKELIGKVNTDSEVITVNDSIVQTFKVKEIPATESEIRIGGGTDIYEGVKYAEENGFTDIITFSDFETYNLSKMLDSVKDGRASYYSIFVGSRGNMDHHIKEYLEACKKHITVAV